MENYMVYTPEAHIAITEVYAENGVVYLKFKKPKTQIYEEMTLDMFLSMVYQTFVRSTGDLWTVVTAKIAHMRMGCCSAIINNKNKII